MQAALPLKRFGGSSEVGDLIAFLAGDQTRFITDVDIPIDDGMLLGSRTSQCSTRQVFLGV
jgi:NAD(P)-dependent dehydrogenase (short-subunit alcohol dehydrogenase family)